MNSTKLSKLEMRSKIQSQEQSVLRLLEFATQYMLKKSEYNLLNPLHYDYLSLKQANDQCQFMIQLNSFTSSKPNSTSIQKSLLNTNKVQNSSLPILPFELTSNVISQIIPLKSNVKSSMQSQKKRLSQQKPKIKQVQSRPIDEIKPRNFSKFPKEQDNSKNHGSISQLTNQIYQSNILLRNFDKNQIIKDSQQSNSEHVVNQSNATDSDDSFQKHNFQKPKEHLDGEQKSFGKADISFVSYHSETDRRQMGVVSEHMSEYENSLVQQFLQNKSQKGKQGNQRNQALDNLFELYLQNKCNLPEEIILSEKSVQSFKSTNQKANAEKPLNEKPLNEKPLNEKPLNEKPITEIILQNTKLQDTKRESSASLAQEQPQIDEFLIKMEALDAQQQSLIKRFTKIWTQQSECIKRIQKLKWQDLKLPKPQFQTRSFNYAEVID